MTFDFFLHKNADNGLIALFFRFVICGCVKFLRKVLTSRRRSVIIKTLKRKCKGSIMLKLENVSKTYLSESKNEVCALKHIDLQLPDSGIVFVVGENGSGKSTLLNVIGGVSNLRTVKFFITTKVLTIITPPITIIIAIR